MNHRRFSAATAVCAVVVLHVGVSLPMFLVATLAPYLETDLGLDETTLGLGIGLFYGVSSVTAVRLGRLADRQSWERGLVIAASSLLIPLGLLWGAVDHVAGLIMILCSIALVQSLTVGTANRAIFDAVPKHRQGLAFGVKQAAIPGAMMLAGLSVPLVADRVGWRLAFLLTGVFPIAAMALTLHRRRAARRRVPLPRLAVSHAKPAASRIRQLRVLAIAVGLGTFTSSSLGAFFVLFAVGRDLAVSAAGIAVAVGSLANISMRIAVGWLADHRGADGFGLAALLLASGSAGYLILSVGRGWWLIAGAVLAYGIGWAWQGLIHVGAVWFMPESPGYASGVVRTGMTAGAGTGPLLSGVLISAIGYSMLWLLLGGLAVAAAAVIFVVQRPAEPPCSIAFAPARKGCRDSPDLPWPGTNGNRPRSLRVGHRPP